MNALPPPSLLVGRARSPDAPPGPGLVPTPMHTYTYTLKYTDDQLHAFTHIISAGKWSTYLVIDGEWKITQVCTAGATDTSSLLAVVIVGSLLGIQLSWTGNLPLMSLNFARKYAHYDYNRAYLWVYHF